MAVQQTVGAKKLGKPYHFGSQPVSEIVVDDATVIGDEGSAVAFYV